MKTKYTKKTVETWLNEVNYDFKGYVPKKEALMFVNFIKEVNDGGEEDTTPLVHLKMMDNVFNEETRCAILCHRGIGKLESPNTRLLTPTGWTTMENIRVGDKVVTREGKSAIVNYKTPLQNPKMYEMELSDGTKLEVGDEHNHIVWMHRKKDREKVLTTTQLLERPLVTTTKRSSTRSPRQSYTYSIPLVEPIEFSHKMLPQDPYVFGLMLADGYFKGGSISCHLDDMLETGKEVSRLGYTVNSMKITSPNGGKLFLSRGSFKEYYDWVFDKKHIPNNYLFASIQQRQALLQGLMDGDGSVTKNGGCLYHSYNKNLAEGVRDIVRSLGGISYIRTYIRDDKQGEEEYQVVVNIKMNPFRLGRKADKWRPTKKTSKAIVAIKEIPSTGGYCIQVDDSTHSYITEGYTVTHNTTLFAEYLILFNAAFGYIPGYGDTSLILYVTDSIENGVKNLRRNIEFRYQNSTFLQKLIPNQKVTFSGNDSDGNRVENVDANTYDNNTGGIRFTDVRLEFMNSKGHRTIVRGYGAKTGVRGTKELGMRPTLAILDDLVSDEDARSDTIIETIKSTVYKAVSKALHPKKQKMVWLGTPFNQKDPLYIAVESGSWQVSVFPVCEHYPVPASEFKGSWPSRFGIDYVDSEYREAQSLNSPQNFNQELMLRITDENSKLVPTSSINWYKRSDLLAKGSQYTWYITTDFTTTGSKGSDYSGMAVWAISSNEDWFLVDIKLRKIELNEQYSSLFRLASIYSRFTGNIEVGIETDGQQKAHIFAVKQMMVKKNQYFTLGRARGKNTEGIGSGRIDKYGRFLNMLHKFQNNKIWFPEEARNTMDMKELLNELDLVTNTGFGSKHDDGLDLLSQLNMMETYSPSKVQTYVKEDGKQFIWEDIPDDNSNNLNLDSYVV